MNIKEIVNILERGGIVIIPTDTVYGIVCNALCEDAVRKVYSIKERSFDKPMIMLVSDFEMLKRYTNHLSYIERELIEHYLPGPITIILKKNKSVPDIVTANKEEVGIRIPDNSELRRLIQKLNKPIIATSANLSSQETITNVSLLEKSIIKKVDYIYDGGTINSSASTIIKVIDDKISIIREGSLTNKIKDNYKDIIL